MMENKMEAKVNKIAEKLVHFITIVI